jgi:hypothetical protein
MPWKNHKRIVSMISATFMLGAAMALAAQRQRQNPARRRWSG